MSAVEKLEEEQIKGCRLRQEAELFGRAAISGLRCQLSRRRVIAVTKFDNTD